MGTHVFKKTIVSVDSSGSSGSYSRSAKKTKKKKKNNDDDDDNDDSRSYSRSSDDDSTSTKHSSNKKHNNDNKKKKYKKHHRHDICLPPQGKTYLTVGQDLYSIQEYLVEQQNASLHWYMNRMDRNAALAKTPIEDYLMPDNGDESSSSEDDSDSSDSLSTHSTKTTKTSTPKFERIMPVPNPDDAVPAALMVYTDIQTLRGLDHPVDYGTGIEYADGALRMASGSASSSSLDVGLQVGLWLNGTAGCQDIVDGKLDRKVHKLVYYLGSKCPAPKIFLRIGYEFDNAAFKYAEDPQLYKEAFAYIVNMCRKHKSCRHRVVMVWHSWAAGLPGKLSLDDFYPGDDLVDWIGVSVFQQFYPKVNNGAFSGGSVKDLEHVLQFAARHHKPTMIAESTPFGGIHNNLHLLPLNSNNNSTSSTTHSNSPPAHNIWEAWFKPTLRLIQDYDIAMWSYINCNWDEQPLWQGVGFGDTRLSIDETLMDHWHNHVINSRRFVRATDNELCVPQDDDDDDDDDDDNTHHGGGRGRGGKHYYDWHYDDDDDHHQIGGDDDYSHGRHGGGHGGSHGRHQHRDFTYDDDAYFERHSANQVGENPSKGSWLWGQGRAARTEGLWNSVLPLVMMSSSLAIVFFMYTSRKRRRSPRRLERTPKAQRVRFATLDAAEEGGTQYATLYGSIRNMNDGESFSNEKKFVRRIGPNLVFSTTADGSTLIS